MTAIDSEIPSGRRLRMILQLATPMIHSGRLTSLWNSPRLNTFYPRYLVAVYPVLKFTVPLILAARDICTERSETSEFHGKLAAYYDRRAMEELGHDLWLLEDLARMGISNEQVKGRTPLPSIAALVGAQHFYIANGQPAALLGYMAALEGFPPTDQLLDAAVEATGYPESYFRTLRKHAHLDIYHRDELDVFIDQVGLGDEDRAVVTSNALACIERVGAAMDDIGREDPLTILDHEH
jgi:Iron-containing redox enzyme